MAKKKSMTRNKDHDRKRIKTWYNGSAAPWSDLNHHMLFLVMMKLGVIDFLAFSGVCKSWRSLALCNKMRFMASRPPMFIHISPRAYKDSCYLKDFEGRKFKTIIPHLVGRTCFGLTCGYLVLFGCKDFDIWLVNPITRHELHFPNAPFDEIPRPRNVRAILVFSPSISKWVFVMVERYNYQIWYSIAGKGSWNYVSANYSIILDLHAFKGKIYTIECASQMVHLSELKLNRKPKLTLLETKNFPDVYLCWDLVSSSENLYLMEVDSEDLYKVHELDFDEMKWVLREKTDEYAFFLCDVKHCSGVKQELWADPHSQYERYADYERRGTGRFFIANMWYFPHDCLNVNCIDG